MSHPAQLLVFVGRIVVRVFCRDRSKTQSLPMARRRTYLSICFSILIAPIALLGCTANEEAAIQETDEPSMQPTDEPSMQATEEPSPQAADGPGVIRYKVNTQAYFHLRVTDLDKAVEFYRDVFGFEVLFEEEATGDLVELSLPCHCVRLALTLVEERSMRPAAGQLMFYVDNVSTTRDYLTSKGVETRDYEIGYGGGIEEARRLELLRTRYRYELFVMLDPFGNEIPFVGNNR